MTDQQRKKVLFVCYMGRDRSRTFAELAASSGEFLMDYAGVCVEAERKLTVDMLEWADVVYCMESYQREQLRKKKPWKGAKKDSDLLTLGVPDEFRYGDPELVKLAREKLVFVLNPPSYSCGSYFYIRYC